MARKERSDVSKTLGLLFTGNRSKTNLKRSMTVLSTGTSIFYDNLIAEEAKERVKQKQAEKLKSEQQKKEEHVVLKQKDSTASRLLWAEAQPVLNSRVLDRITAYDRTVQEAKFEIITSEITYLNSLNELITKYMGNRELSRLCTAEQWQDLFANITVVKAASELVLSDLVQHWHEDLMLTNIYTVLRQHAISILRVYKEYCRKQPFCQQLLMELNENKEWKRVLEKVEGENRPNNSLQSYLALPMQRVTRLPLLLEVISTHLQEGTNEFTACKLAMSALKKLTKDCNESVGREEENPILQLINKGISKENNGTAPRPPSWSSTNSWEV